MISKSKGTHLIKQFILKVTIAKATYLSKNQIKIERKPE